VLTRFANEYGGIYRVRLVPGMHVVVVSDPVIVERALGREENLPRYRYFYRPIDPLAGKPQFNNFMTTPIEDEWKTVRKVLAHSMAQDTIRKQVRFF
jgi:hypothetical protein